MVILTVGRPMRSELDALLPMVECLQPRRPREFREWVLAKCKRFAQVPELREPVLLHEGPFKWFHEELYPLSVFVMARYGDRDDVFCVPKRDQSRDVDAEIHEPSRQSRSRSRPLVIPTSIYAWRISCRTVAYPLPAR